MMPRKKKPRSGRHTASVGGTSQGAFSGTSMGSLNQQADSESDSLQPRAKSRGNAEVRYGADAGKRMS